MKMPVTIVGTPLRMSSAKRIVEPTFADANSVV